MEIGMIGRLEGNEEIVIRVNRLLHGGDEFSWLTM